MSRTFEHLYPWMYAVAASVAFWICDLRLPADANLPGLLSASISVSAILVGFLATMKSIMMALPAAVERVKAAGYMEDLVAYLASSIAGNLIFCTMNLSAFFPWVGASVQLFSVLWIGVAVFSLISFWRITRIMTMLLRMA